MALTGRGGQSGGPRYGWGGVPNDPGAGARSGSAGSRTNFNSGLNGGRYTNSPEAGLHRGVWQWQGHGPSAQRDYGWDYQGGVGRDEITQHTEARTGGSYLSHMAQDRGGGLPRYSQDYDAGDRGFPHLGQGGGRGYARDLDRGGRGGVGGYGGGGTGGYGRGGQYDEGFRSAGGGTVGGGHRGGFRGGLAPAFGGQYEPGMGGRSRGAGYGRDFDEDRYGARGGPTLGGGSGRSGVGGGYGADFGGYRGQMNRGGGQQATYGFGARQGGGYGREFGQGRALSGRGGGYGAGYSRPLTDDEFYSRVNRW